MLHGWLVAWLITIMFGAQPIAPWLDTYQDTAFAIADAAEAHPLFKGHLAVERTALLLLSVSKFESSWDPNAVGDGGESLGLFQINRVHAPANDLLIPGRAAPIAANLIETSFRICRSHPLEERLGWYAWGRTGCEHAHAKSKHRIELAERYLREYPIANETSLSGFVPNHSKQNPADRLPPSIVQGLAADPNAVDEWLDEE